MLVVINYPPNLVNLNYHQQQIWYYESSCPWAWFSIRFYWTYSQFENFMPGPAHLSPSSDYKINKFGGHKTPYNLMGTSNKHALPSDYNINQYPHEIQCELFTLGQTFGPFKNSKWSSWPHNTHHEFFFFFFHLDSGPHQHAQNNRTTR